MEEHVTFRPATLEDAPFVALVMMEAVGMPMMEEGRMPEEHIIDVCRRIDTLYTYRNAVIAEVDGMPVGGLIAYVGKGYHDIKMNTFAQVAEHLTFDFTKMDDETREGEFYLDSAAVLPEHRGKGYGRQILEYGLSLAHKQQLLPVLACDRENTRAYNLYRSLGFKEDGELFIFGEHYLRMTCR